MVVNIMCTEQKIAVSLRIVVFKMKLVQSAVAQLLLHIALVQVKEYWY